MNKNGMLFFKNIQSFKTYLNKQKKSIGLSRMTKSQQAGSKRINTVKNGELKDQKRFLESQYKD